MFPDNSVFLESSTPETGFGPPVLFTRPHAIVRANSVSTVRAAFAEADRYLSLGYYIAGYVAYEAGYAFEERFSGMPAGAGALVWFGIYDAPVLAGPTDIPPAELFPGVDEAAFTPTLVDYRRAIGRILDYIAQGDVYQINYTGRLDFPVRICPFALFSQVRQRQQTAFSAYIRHQDRHVLSFSPELFFRVSDGVITTQPMKGTTGRGRTGAEDRERAEQLRSCPKNRAENTMIVDLLRNDLGRVSKTGSVTVESLFDVARYETLHQMTSTVSGALCDGVRLSELFGNLFPCGSVTGAPKVRAMEIIHELEDMPRGVYTGAIGYAAPDGNMCFSVAIRTVAVEHGRGTLGLGSGIVADSGAEAEYQECLLKALFLTESGAGRAFQLIETMRCECGIPLLDLHMERLSDSASYFGFSCDTDMIRREVLRFASALDSASVHRIRLLLSPDGSISVESALLPEESHEPARIAIAGKPVSSASIFQYHKTTWRDFYTAELQTARQRGLFDLLFLNERGEVAEGCITNVFIEKEGVLLTPPVSCGLLAGVWRRHVLETYPDAQEVVLMPEDLRAAERIFIGNAVRGMMPAVLVGQESDAY